MTRLAGPRNQVLSVVFGGFRRFVQRDLEIKRLLSCLGDSGDVLLATPRIRVFCVVFGGFGWLLMKVEDFRENS